MWDAELEEVLRKTALLSTLNDEERAELGATGRIVRARRGSTLIRQGDEAGGMSVVLSGHVRIDIELRDGRRQTLATLSSGEVFGELSLLDHAPRSASAIADGDARVFLINAQEFEALRKRYRPAAHKLLRAMGPTLSRRLRAVEKMIAERLHAEPQPEELAVAGPEPEEEVNEVVDSYELTPPPAPPSALGQEASPPPLPADDDTVDLPAAADVSDSSDTDES